MKHRNSKGEYVFTDYPHFRPNLSPKEIFEAGSFGGTYWRPIKSSVTGKKYENVHRKYPAAWWKDIPENMLIRPYKEYDESLNKYGVKVGLTLQEWENNEWITKYHPYGWIHWYCDFFLGKRGPDDERQVERWMSLASKRGRFRKWLINFIIQKNGEWNDASISPKMRQTLQHWAYKLTKRDFNDQKTEKKKEKPKN